MLALRELNCFLCKDFFFFLAVLANAGSEPLYNVRMRDGVCFSPRWKLE